MRIDWLVPCITAETDPATGFGRIEGAGIKRLEAEQLPVGVDLDIAAQISGLPAGTDSEFDVLKVAVRAPDGTVVFERRATARATGPNAIGAIVVRMDVIFAAHLRGVYVIEGVAGDEEDVSAEYELYIVTGQA